MGAGDVHQGGQGRVQGLILKHKETNHVVIY